MDIWLYLDSNGITQQQWEAVRNKYYELLQCFPLPLAWGVKNGLMILKF